MVKKNKIENMVKKNKIEKLKIMLIIIGLVFISIIVMNLFDVFKYLEYKSYDLRVRYWTTTTHSIVSPDVVVIVIEQDSLDWAQKERGWGWPWPREAYAEIIDYMNLSDAKAIAFDIIFSEPSIYRNARQDEIIDNAVRVLEEAEIDMEGQSGTGRPGRAEGTEGRPPQSRDDDNTPRGRGINRVVIETILSIKDRVDDESFINASINYGNVVQAVMFSSQTGSITSWPSGLDKPLFEPINFESIIDKYSVGSNEKGLFPIPGLIDSAAALGSVTAIPDFDGIVRRIRPFTLFDGQAIPGLSSALLLVSGKDNKMYYNKRTNRIDWDGISIPVDKNGTAILRYRGKLERYILYRAMDMILSGESIKRGEKLEAASENFTEMGTRWGMYTPDNFTDTYVFLGLYAHGLFDIFSTPITSVYQGMGVHVTMLDNILQNDLIHESPDMFNYFILLLIITLIVGLAIFSNRITISVGGMIFIVAAIVVGSFLAYQFGNLWVPMISFLAGALVSFVTATLYNYATEGSQKRFIKSAFSQYLSPKVIEQIINDPSQLQLGGEKRTMTAIFTDVRAFSTISEALGDPTKLVELLNFYLTRMSNIVMDNQGTIDKYEGDAIIAFFGAPVHFDNHASLACRAVVRMKKAEAEINRKALEKGLVTPEVMQAMAAKGIISSIDDPYPLFTRIGMNTGEMVVGNMGTPNKMDYTIMGNAVNLAARLEGVNKQYDTGGILISEYTREHIGDEFILRPLSKVRVVGINTPLRLYELLDIASEASPELLDMVKNWEMAFNLYEKRDFTAALNLFQEICNKNSGDLAAKKYLIRCIKYQSTPPDEKTWDNGVDNLTEK